MKALKQLITADATAPLIFAFGTVSFIFNTVSIINQSVSLKANSPEGTNFEYPLVRLVTVQVIAYLVIILVATFAQQQLTTNKK